MTGLFSTATKRQEGAKKKQDDSSFFWDRIAGFFRINRIGG
jgi:hypothetical protein